MLLQLRSALQYYLGFQTMSGFVQTSYGPLKGVTSDKNENITVYKGIPYAASTAGDSRWKAPQPPSPWTEIRDADSFGFDCPQSHGDPNKMSEDCLSLNIWTPTADATEGLPVYVWIYGGRFIFGSGSQEIYDGTALASKGVIVVTINYRLGIFGFLSTPELSQESGHDASGNYGLLDQIMALKWVQENIAAFGGDPSRVTIGGQSAGSASVNHLVNSPLAKGLFKGAICQSSIRHAHDPILSGLAASYRTQNRAEEIGIDFMKLHNVSSVAEMRKLPAQDLLLNTGANDPIPGSPPLFRPVLDGWVVPETYAQVLDNGHQNDVTILAGNNGDEGGASPGTDISLSEYQSSNSQKYGDLSDRYFELYPASNKQEAIEATNAAARDAARVSTWLWANDWASKAKSKVFTYFWTHAPPGAQGAKRGAYHGSEIFYAFNNLDTENLPWTDTDIEIADTMSDYWVNFIKGGDPNGENLSAWAASTPHQSSIMDLGSSMNMIPTADDAKVQFHAEYLKSQPAW